MPLLTLVNATDLDAWADTREAQDRFPLFLRRLIRASVGKLKRCEFRAAEGVHLSGWDGIVETERGNAYVPNGFSGWELGVGKNIKAKANKDYESRRDDPLELDPLKSTFIFATPRRWGKKNDWVRERKEEGVWSEVRAFDADDLHTWLETTPAIHIWISILLGKHPQGAEDSNTYWSGWSKATDPPITSDILLAGREKITERIHEWLRGSPTVLSVKTETRSEAIAFFAASLQKLSLEEMEKYLSRSVVVYTRDAWNELIDAEAGLILIPEPGYSPGEAITRAIEKGHFVLHPADRSDGKLRNACEVPKLHKEKAKEAFSAAGLPYEKAWRLAGLARRSIMSLRRKLAQHNYLGTPDWSKPENSHDLVPAMLAGGWLENKPADLELMSKLAQQPYVDFKKAKLEVWSHKADPPVRKVGDAWYVVSREDAWNLLSEYITKEDLENFEKLVVGIFSEALPEFELPDEERYMANVMGYESKHSGLLYRGMADTLALMGARGADAAISSGTTASDYARHIVRQILENAGEDWKLWASIVNILSQLAEAAPDEVLNALQRDLDSDEPTIKKLFRDQDTSWHVSSPHTGLLWALEEMCWSEDYLGRVALILARLAELDPGGKMLNRPIHSLREIFLYWHPCTSASKEQRLRVLDTIRNHAPAVAWVLCKNLLPRGHEIADGTQRPTWREWLPEDVCKASVREGYETVKGIVERMLVDVGKAGQRWMDLITSLGHLPDDIFDLIVTQMENMDQESLADSDRTIIWHALREHISHHRSFPDSDWSHEPPKIDRLAAIFDQYIPNEILERYAWLFDHSPKHPLGEKESWQEHQKLIDKEQHVAVAEILDQLGTRGIIDLAVKVERPGLIGGIIGENNLLEENVGTLLVENLASDNEKLAEFARGIVLGLMQAKGKDWIESRLPSLIEKLSIEQVVQYLACLPCNKRTWELADKLSPAASDNYWRNIGAHMFYRTDDVELAVHNLLEHDRPYAAVKVLGLIRDDEQRPPAKLLIEALDQMAHTEPGPHDRIDSYRLGQLFEYLGSLKGVDEKKVAELEFLYLPALRDRGAPHFLKRILTDSPEFFADVVAMGYRGEGEESRESSQENRERARRAWELLNLWRLNPNAKSDPQWLNEWVHRAREKLTAMNRIKIGDQMIGKALSWKTYGADGAWPHDSIRNVIEDVASKEIERGIQLGVYNARGVASKSLYEGGAQERELAKRYSQYAQIVRDQWPRTAALLNRISEGYISDALREDQRAELDQDLGR